MILHTHIHLNIYGMILFTHIQINENTSTKFILYKFSYTFTKTINIVLNANDILLLTRLIN